MRYNALIFIQLNILIWFSTLTTLPVKPREGTSSPHAENNPVMQHNNLWPYSVEAISSSGVSSADTKKEGSSLAPLGFYNRYGLNT